MTYRSFNSPVIRTMAASDLERIIEIDVKVLEKSRPEYWEMKLELVSKQPQFSSLVAEMDGKVIGFIIGGASRWEYGVPENIGWVDTIGVDPDYQRKGIAKMLFKKMTHELKKMGVDTITTFVKRRDPLLLEFFNSLGFQKGDMVNLELDI
ncbi:GNAT family N-acetyltransferase [Desulfobacula toluolica]|uniref:BamK: predicted GCN5-related N-acetyltransferase, associated with benzoate catabolic cluster n=1 Tax=Desulfobacula toluolica (strain DSM 7467 / Tol2) TaxID=651182 RepID=K0NCX6_DESTT|nr:GNAT family N-acetyltransferase [Desulfobacula toluolica]CCK78550.1 BamK: predicted GCN5-related N-acetyltransferase, associated with benzoate catabolic cluster [Desulfobacula toluolica Tol2]